jgi:ribosomal protein S11
MLKKNIILKKYIKKPTNFFILYINITKNNLKVSINKLNGNVIFKKTEGCLKQVRKGSINSADTSLIMMGDLDSNISKLKIKYLGIYIRGATR